MSDYSIKTEDHEQHCDFGQYENSCFYKWAFCPVLERRKITNLPEKQMATKNIDERIDKIFKRCTYRCDVCYHGEDFDQDQAKQSIKSLLREVELGARKDGMLQAKSRVLRRTEIPKDAKNPTRDYIVILGEQIAGFIDDDITELDNLLGSK